MQVAIVTGASSGIGFGCATKLAQMGMAVLGVGRDENRLAELAKALEESTGDPERVATLAVDLIGDDAPRRIVDLAVTRWGHIDFLINNAGVGNPKPLDETDDETLDYSLNLMLRAPFRLARDVLPHMPPGSAIINVTSTFAVVGGLRGGAYSAAKGGLIAMTVDMAYSHGRQGIRVNAVAPGHITTPMVMSVSAPGARAEFMNTMRSEAGLLGTPGTGWDVGWAAAFLASDEARWITGVTLPVESGVLSVTPLMMAPHLRAVPDPAE